AGVPLAGVVSRLALQKGIELMFDALPRVLDARALALVVLGRGEPQYEQFFSDLERRYSERVSYQPGYHDELAHWIEAASDMFLMPSRYEPCGLNQMYSLRYGTVPIVRRTGGLADSVEHYDPASGRGTGVVFNDFDAPALEWALNTALDLYTLPAQWTRMVRNGMQCDFSWQRQGAQYLELYRRLTGGTRRTRRTESARGLRASRPAEDAVELRAVARELRGQRTGWQTPQPVAAGSPGSIDARLRTETEQILQRNDRELPDRAERGPCQGLGHRPRCHTQIQVHPLTGVCIERSVPAECRVVVVRAGVDHALAHVPVGHVHIVGGAVENELQHAPSGEGGSGPSGGHV